MLAHEIIVREVQANSRPVVLSLLAEGVGKAREAAADALGVSVQAVRQARAAEGSTARRPPPEGWERAVSTWLKTGPESWQP